MASVSNINSLLEDKLYQVIGSTPASIAEALKKVDLKNKTDIGGQMFAICIFAAAVNKPTLETFIADSRFASVRPLINAALSISGRSNMTALTLLGHCFLTTDLASDVVFAAEFRKKMGQSNIWNGELESGSLSDVQKKILKEKKRITSEKEAKALGSGFLKHCGIMSGRLEGLEVDYFGTGVSPANVINQRSTGTALLPTETVASGVNRRDPRRQDYARQDVPAAPAEASGSGTSRQTTRNDFEARPRRVSDEVVIQQDVPFNITRDSQILVPEDVLNYRRNALRQSDAEIAESINRRGMESFVSSTRDLAIKDPTGDRTRAAASTAR